MRRAVFLDRDGVICENRADYVKAWEEFVFLPGSLEALRRLAESPFAVVVISNQSSVGRGLMSASEVVAIHQRMVERIEQKGGRVDGFYYCPHVPEDGCECRKPQPGLLLRASEEKNLDLPRSYMIGDAQSDVEAAMRAGCIPILVRTGRGVIESFNVPPSILAPETTLADLAEAVAWLLDKPEGGRGVMSADESGRMGDPPVTDPVDEYLKRMALTVSGMPRDQIWAVVEVLFRAWQRGNMVFLLGNGGSAATASHMANDFNKLASVDGQRRMKALALTDNVPLITAWGNDDGFENVFVEQLQNFLGMGDVVIGISTSGNSPNVLKALEFARDNGAVTVGLTGNIGGRLRTLVDACVFVPDDNICRQEDAHMVLDHVISLALRWKIERHSLDE